MDYRIGIVGHTSRQEWIDELAAAVSADVVSVDDGTLGVGGNHLKVLHELHDQWPDQWMIVLEDDAVVGEDFNPQLAMILDNTPVLGGGTQTSVVSLYLGTGYPFQYQQIFTNVLSENPDVCWLVHGQMRHAVAYCIHPGIARPLLIRLDELITAKKYAPDDAIGWWTMRNSVPIGYTNPSIVGHRDEGTVIDYRMHLGHPQAAGRKLPRVAHNFGTRPQWDNTFVGVVRPWESQRNLSGESSEQPVNG